MRNLMKYLLVFIISTVCVFAAGEKKLSDIKDITANVREVIYLNGEAREKTYSIEYIAPDYLRKVIKTPKANKGEIFQYENGGSRVYIPLFNEVKKGNDQEDVNNMLSIINDLKYKDKNDPEFSKKYYARRVDKLNYKKRYTIKIKGYSNVGEFLIPVSLDIYEKNTKVASLSLTAVSVNKGIRKKALK